MTTPSADAGKRALIEGLRAARQAVHDALIAVPPEHFDDQALDDWSIRDVLAHLSGWDFTLVKAAREIQAGDLPAFYQYWDKDWRSYNALLVSLYKRADAAQQVAALEDSHARLVDYLETVPADAIPADHGARFKDEPVTIQGLIDKETRDEHIHAARIRDFADRLAR